jgi:single-strand DNA-binding protein
MKYTPNGQAVTTYSVATNRRWKDKDGNNQDQTEFHNIVAWGKLAEISNQYLKKGNKVYIEGRLSTRNWEGQDGSKRNRTEIITENIIFLTPKGAAGESTPSAPDDIEEFPINEPSATKDTEEKKPAAKTEVKEEKDLDEINLDDIPF